MNTIPWQTFLTCIVSPQLASIIGPGNCPLTRITLLGTPSGAMVPREIVKSYGRITPVTGTRDSMYGFVLLADFKPHGNPLGSG